MTADQIVLVAEKQMGPWTSDHRYGHVHVSVASVEAHRVCWLVDRPFGCNRKRYYANLKATCQMDERGCEPYSLAIEYHTASPIEWHQARQMHATLKRIHRQLDRMSASAGPAMTFGHYVTRFAHVIKADGVLIECEGDRMVEVLGFGNAYRQVRSYITEEVNGLCKEVRTALRANKEEAA